MPAIMNRKYAVKSKQFSHQSKWRASNFIRDMDSFGKEVPSFNVKGETHVNTVPGGLMNLLILAATLGYAITKFADLATGKDPQITESKELDYYGPADKLDLGSTSFRLAIGGRGNIEYWYHPATD